MKKLNNRGSGFVGILAVIVVLAVAGGIGAYVYHKHHKANSTTSGNTSSNNSSVGKSGTTQTPDPYAGWKTYTDSIYHYSFKYPADWQLSTASTSNIGDSGSANIMNPAKTVQVIYNNAFTKDSGAIAFTPSFIGKFTGANEDLTVVGGYSPAGGLVGNYQPSYHVVDSSFLTTYPLTVGQQSQFQNNPRFTDKGTGNLSYSGELVSLPINSINTVADAQTWLNSADAKTSLLILQSLTYQQ